MKTLLPAVLAPLIFSVVSCAPSTPQSRIDHNPAVYARLSDRDKSLARQGSIARGMSMDAVWISWGSADRTFDGARAGKSMTRWDYTASEPTYTTSFFSGFGYGGYGPYGGRYRGYGVGFGPEVSYVPTLRASVTFLDRKVDSWERRR